jgi:hypothetical protein
VKVNPVPRAQWQNKFVAQGMPPNRTPPRIEMIEGFNSGRIEFERKGANSVKGHVTIDEALRKLV